MATSALKTVLTQDELASLGEGTVAYLREIDSSDLDKFPGAPKLEPGTRIWAVFAASGRPIMLTDGRDSALAGVRENDLTPVSIH